MCINNNKGLNRIKTQEKQDNMPKIKISGDKKLKNKDFFKICKNSVRLSDPSS